MRGIRFELWLATTAIALIVVGWSLPIQSAPLTEAEISAAVPMPEPANLPPPSARDIVAPATTAPDSVRPTAVAPTNATPDITTPAAVAPAAAAPAEAPALTIDQ